MAIWIERLLPGNFLPLNWCSDCAPGFHLIGSEARSGAGPLHPAELLFPLAWRGGDRRCRAGRWRCLTRSSSWRNPNTVLVQDGQKFGVRFAIFNHFLPEQFHSWAVAVRVVVLQSAHLFTPDSGVGFCALKLAIEKNV